jgi:hypothetical protein
MRTRIGCRETLCNGFPDTFAGTCDNDVHDDGI